MQRLLVIGLLVLATCVGERASPGSLPSPEPGADANAKSTSVPLTGRLGGSGAEPREPVEAVDEQRAEILRWQACHPIEVAHVEFEPGESRADRDTSKAELERVVARWNAPPGDDQGIAKILIKGWRSADEGANLDDLRAAGIRSELLEAGIPADLMLAAGFEVGGHTETANRSVTLLEICGICCIL